jgi:hypothetical protein
VTSGSYVIAANVALNTGVLHALVTCTLYAGTTPLDTETVSVPGFSTHSQLVLAGGANSVTSITVGCSVSSSLPLVTARGTISSIMVTTLN